MRSSLAWVALAALAAVAASAQDAPRLVPQAEDLWLPTFTFTADGDRLLTVDRTGGAALWDVATGATLLPMPGQDARPSPGAAAVVQFDNEGRATLWDLAAGRALAWLPPDAEAVFVGPHQVAMAAGDGTAAVRDLSSGRVLAALEGWSSAWSLDDSRMLPGWVAGRDGGSVRLWDAVTGAPVPELDGAWEWTASPDGARVLAAFDPPGRPGRWEVWAGRPPALRLRIAGVDAVRADAALARVLVVGGAAVRVADLDAGTVAVGPVHGAPVREAALSADGAWAATLDADGRLRVWTAASGGATTDVATSEPFGTLTLSPDGRWVAIEGDAGTRVWASATGREALQTTGVVTFGPRDHHAVADSLFNASGPVSLWDARTGARTPLTAAGASPTFSADGRHLVLETPGGTAAVWDVATGVRRSVLRSRIVLVAHAAFGPDGRGLLTTVLPTDPMDFSGELSVDLWDVAGTGAPRRVGEPLAMLQAPALSSDGTRVLAVESGGETGGGAVRMWDAVTGATQAAWGGGSDSVLVAAWTEAGGRAVAVAAEGLSLRAAGTGDILRPLDGSAGEALAAALSADGRRAAAVFFSDAADADGHEIRVWDAETGTRLVAQTVLGLPLDIAFDPASERLVTADVGGGIRVWTAAVELLVTLDGHEADVARSAVFGPDGRRVLSTGRDGLVRTWDAETGAPGPTFAGYGGPVDARVVSADGRRAVTPREGGAAVWDLATGAELARLLLLDDGGWLVVTPDGRFDAPDLEAIDAAVWVAPDDPLTPLPIEAFMADFYEPRLLARVLAGERFQDFGRLLDRNRVQPRVEITATALTADGTATVTVEVEGRARTYDGTRHVSGAYDLRLFRDGKLVAWRDGPLVDGEGRQSVVFAGVPLPSDADTVAFSAYAFNVDRVKSRTARAEMAVPAGPDRPRRAFVVALGVDAFADPAWDLAFAAADARAYTAALEAALAATGDYDEVVTVALVSDGVTDHGTAAALRGALLRLAGEELDAAARAALVAVSGADRLAVVTPDDAVIVTASTHGYADGAGVFYLLPSDVPETGRRLTPEVLEAAVSSDELSAWLRGVDAGALALVVDACNAAGVVEGTGFKPGPMGARGLGQLAFDKGAAVLTATQADAPALEAAATGRGLLTFALVENGLLAGQADGAGAEAGAPDGRITLAEWLAYGAARVPVLAAEVRAGAVETFGRGGVRTRQLTDEEAPAAEVGLQTPALFDFRRDARPVSVADVR